MNGAGARTLDTMEGAQLEVAQIHAALLNNMTGKPKPSLAFAWPPRLHVAHGWLWPCIGQGPHVLRAQCA